MSAIIDYYFFGLSSFGYLGHQAILDVALKHGATLNFKPVDLRVIWEASGAVRPSQRPAVRQRYRSIDLQRTAHMRGLPINLNPAHTTFDSTLADSCVIALTERGEDPSSYMTSVFRGVWAEDAIITEEEQIAEYLKTNGFEPDTIIADAKTDAVASRRDAYTKEAIDRDAVGVPTYVLNGEVFWGQDRIEAIDHALKTGRAAFSADAG